jgi:hypothetical protein
MAALRGDISFRYLKQFFLVIFVTLEITIAYRNCSKLYHNALMFRKFGNMFDTCTSNFLFIYRRGSFTSTTSHGLTANQLADHYTNCIKLSAENVIISNQLYICYLPIYIY